VEGISEDDPIVQKIRDDVLRETGVALDQLMNPAKVRHEARVDLPLCPVAVHGVGGSLKAWGSHVQVVNLEFDLINLRNELDLTNEGRARDKIVQVTVTFK
jgi:hypothetical protein